MREASDWMGSVMWGDMPEKERGEYEAKVRDWRGGEWQRLKRRGEYEAKLRRKNALLYLPDMIKSLKSDEAKELAGELSQNPSEMPRDWTERLKRLPTRDIETLAQIRGMTRERVEGGFFNWLGDMVGGVYNGAHGILSGMGAQEAKIAAMAMGWDGERVNEMINRKLILKAAAEAKRGGVRHELSDVLGDDAFNMAGWLDAKARSGSAQPTRFKVYRGRDALPVLAECTEAEKPSFDRGGTENDKEPFNWEADSVEMFIMPGDGSARQIVVTPAGGVWAAKDGDISWKSGAVVRPSFAEGRWTLSLSLPYASFGGAPKTGDRWKFMIIRNAARDSKFKACGWPVNAHRDFSSAATLLF